MAADIEIDEFMADGRNFIVSYDITGDAGTTVAPFHIAVYKSTNGTDPVGNAITDIEISNVNQRTLGSNFQATFSATFADATTPGQEPDNFYLVAKVDANGDVTETNESNNVSGFAGGAFLTPVDPQNPSSGNYLEVMGTDYSDTVRLTESTAGLSFTFTRPSGSVTLTNSYTYTTSDAIQEIHARLYDGDDLLRTTPVNSDKIALGKRLIALGGVGNDTLWSGKNDPAIHDSLFGDAGDDILIDGAEGGKITLAGGAGSDTYVFRDAQLNSTVTAVIIESASDSGTDTLDFSSRTQAITLNLSSLSNQSIATEFRVDLTSASGIESVLGTTGNDSVTANALGNLLVGNAGNDTLVGNSGNDTLMGGVGNDTLQGQAGNDTYSFSGTANLGTDSINESAGQGNDTLDFGGMTSGVTVNLGTAGAQTANTSLTLNLNNAAVIENAVGSSGNDSLTGNALDNTLAGGPGNDTLAADGGNDTYVYSGTSSLGYDTVNEGTAADADTLDFSGLNGSIALNLGQTISQSLNALVSLLLNQADGVENARGTSGNDTITGNARANLLVGSDGNDTLDGNADDDILIGGAGNDQLQGGADNDTYSYSGAVNFGSDTISDPNSDPGIDLLDFSALGAAVAVNLGLTAAQTINSSLTLTLSQGDSIENVFGGSGNDMLTGNALANWLVGNAGNDTLNGGDGNDTLDGNADDDILIGGAGNDQLQGGADNDTYSYSGAVNFGSDTISDPNSDPGIDLLDFSALGAAVAVNLGLTAAQTINSSLTLTLSQGDSIENVFGGSGNDMLTGNALANWLVGNADNDTISGGDGNDTVSGGAGDDSLAGGDGSDLYTFAGSSSLGTDVITDSQETDPDAVGNTLDFHELEPDSSTDAGITLDLADTATQVVRTGILSLTLSADDSIGVVIGTRGDDDITGGGTDATTAFIGGPGNDTLTGSAGGHDTFIFVNLDNVSGWDIGSNHPSGGHVAQGSDTINETSNARNSIFFGDSTDGRFRGLSAVVPYTGGFDSPGLTWLSSYVEPAEFPQLSWLAPYDAEVNLDLRSAMEGVAQAVTDYGAFENYLTLTINGVGNFQNVFGSSQQSNTIYGNDLANYLLGGAGADLLDAGGGHDVLIGNPAIFDELYAGTDGDDVLIGGEGDDVLVGSTGDDTLTGGGGNDLVCSNPVGVGVDSVNNGDDVLEGNAGIDVLVLGDGDDRLLYRRLTSSDDLGTDLILQNGESSGISTIDFSDYQAAITFSLNEDSFIDPGVYLMLFSYDEFGEGSYDPALFGAHIENVVGSAFDDMIVGNELDNVLEGGGGDDILVGGGGNDTLSGGDDSDTYELASSGILQLIESAMDDGTDTLDFSDSDDGIALDLGTTVSQALNSSLTLTLSDPAGFEDVIGTDYDDSVTANAQDNLLSGGTGSDTYYFAGSAWRGSDEVVESSSNPSEDIDRLDFSALGEGIALEIGTTAAQLLNGLLSLTLSDDEGIEEVVGTNHADWILGNALDNLVFGNAGDDTLIGGDGDDTLPGQAGNDTLVGDGGPGDGTNDDVLEGGDGDDILVGGDGDDTLDGGAGVDTLDGDGGFNLIPGDNILHGGDGFDRPEILDDSESGFTTSGSWTSISAGFNRSELSATTGANNTATWTFDNLGNGLYQVFATWEPQSGAATQAPFVVDDGSTTTTITQNQTLQPGGPQEANHLWVQLGVFSPTDGTLAIELRGDSSGAVLADAVRLVAIAAPKTTGIPDVTVEESAPSLSIDLSQYFSDDAPGVTLKYSVMDNTNGTIVSPSIDGVTLTLSFTPGIFDESTDITIRATDTFGAFVESTFTVTIVEASNHRPTTAGLDDITVLQNGANTTINLASAFSDPEQSATSLSYIVSTNTNTGLFASTNIVDAQLVLAYATDKVGVANFTITATDNGGLTAQASFKVTVNSIPPTISNLRLLNDTGANPSDRITTDSRLTGSVVRYGNTNPIVVQFDTNGDGHFDSTVPVSNDGTFTYSPFGLENETHTITAKAVDSLTITSGNPSSLTFTLEPKVGPSVAALALVNDTGTSSTDGITSNLEVEGYITSEESVVSQRVEIDYTGDDIADGSTYTDTEGSFSFLPVGLDLGSTVTLRARAANWDSTNGQYLYGDWRSMTLRPVAPPTPTISLSLSNDTGTPNDHITTDPAVSGSLSFAGSVAYLTVQFDYNGDDHIDATTVTDATGHFHHVPTRLLPGEITLRARAAIYDTVTSQQIVGAWASLEFELEADPNSVPGQPDGFTDQQTAAQEIVAAFDEDRLAAIIAGIAAFNDAFGSGVTTAGLFDVGIGTYDTSFLLVPISIPNLGSYDFQSGYLPTSPGTAPPFSLFQPPSIPTSLSYSNTLTISDSGSAGPDETYVLSGTNSIVRTQTIDTVNHRFTISILQTFQYTRTQEGTYTDTVGTREDDHSYHRTVSGGYGFNFIASGSYSETSGSVTLSGDFNLSAADISVGGAFSDTVDYTDSSNGASGTDIVTGEQSELYSEWDFGGHFSVTPAVASVSSGFYHAQGGEYSLSHSASDSYSSSLDNGSRHGPHSHNELASYSHLLVAYGNYSASGSTTLISAQAYERTASTTLTSSDYYPANTYSLTFADGIETGTETNSFSSSYTEEHIEYGNFAVTDSSFSLDIDSFDDEQSGTKISTQTANGTYSAETPDYSSDVNVTRSASNATSYSHSSSGSYSVSPENESVTGSAFLSDVSSTEYFYLRESGEYELSGPENTALVTRSFMNAQGHHRIDDGSFRSVNGSVTVDGNVDQNGSTTSTYSGSYAGDMIGAGTLLNTITNNFSSSFADVGTYHSDPDLQSSSGNLTIDRRHTSSASFSAIKAYSNGSGYGIQDQYGTATASTTLTESASYDNSVGSGGTDETYSGDMMLIVVDDRDNHAVYSGGYSGGIGGQSVDGSYTQSHGAFVSSSYSTSGDFVGDNHTGDYINTQVTRTSQMYSDIGTASGVDCLSNHTQWYSISQSTSYDDAGHYDQPDDTATQTAEFEINQRQTVSAIYTDNVGYEGITWSGAAYLGSTQSLSTTANQSGNYVAINGARIFQSASFTDSAHAQVAADFTDEGSYTDNAGGGYWSAQQMSGADDYMETGSYVETAGSLTKTASFTWINAGGLETVNSDTRQYHHAVAEGTVSTFGSMSYGANCSRSGSYSQGPTNSSASYAYEQDSTASGLVTVNDDGTYHDNRDGDFSDERSYSATYFADETGTVNGPKNSSSTHDNYTLDQWTNESATHSASFIEVDGPDTVTVDESFSSSFSSHFDQWGAEDISPSGDYDNSGSESYTESHQTSDSYSEIGHIVEGTVTQDFDLSYLQTMTATFSSNGNFSIDGDVYSDGVHITSTNRDGDFDTSTSTSFSNTVSSTNTSTASPGNSATIISFEDMISVTTNREWGDYVDDNGDLYREGYYEDTDSESISYTVNANHAFNYPGYRSGGYSNTETYTSTMQYSSSGIVDDEPSSTWRSGTFAFDEQVYRTASMHETATSPGFSRGAYFGYGYYDDGLYYPPYLGWYWGMPLGNSSATIDEGVNESFSYHEEGTAVVEDAVTASASLTFNEYDYSVTARQETVSSSLSGEYSQSIGSSNRVMTGTATAYSAVNRGESGTYSQTGTFTVTPGESGPTEWESVSFSESNLESIFYETTYGVGRTESYSSSSSESNSQNNYQGSNTGNTHLATSQTGSHTYTDGPGGYTTFATTASGRDSYDDRTFDSEGSYWSTGSDVSGFANSHLSAGESNATYNHAFHQGENVTQVGSSTERTGSATDDTSNTHSSSSTYDNSYDNPYCSTENSGGTDQSWTWTSHGRDNWSPGGGTHSSTYDSYGDSTSSWSSGWDCGGDSGSTGGSYSSGTYSNPVTTGYGYGYGWGWGLYFYFLPANLATGSGSANGVKPNEVDTVVTAPDSSGDYLNAGTGGAKGDSMANSGTPVVEQELAAAGKDPGPRAPIEMESVFVGSLKGAGKGFWAGTLSLVSALPFVGRLTGEARDRAFEDVQLKGSWTETITKGSAEVGIGALGTVLSGGTNHVATVVNAADKLDAGMNVAEGAARMAQGDAGGALQAGLGGMGMRGSGKAGDALADHAKKANPGVAADVAQESTEKLKKQAGCFFAGTIVASELGPKPIESVRAEDRVWSCDLVTGQWTLCRAVETYETDYIGEQVRFKIAGEWIESTRHHPIWVVEGADLADRPRPDHVKSAETVGATVSGRWVDARDLLVGDVLLLHPDRRARIDAIELQAVVAKVYNFQVERLHNYAVGLDCVLVHNNAPCAAGGASNNLVTATSQLQKKFKHAADFGITGNPTKANVEAFEAAIRKHVGDGAVQHIAGTLRNEPVVIHVDPNTGLAVITDTTGTFISGWKLSAQQLWHVLNGGKLGGG